MKESAKVSGVSRSESMKLKIAAVLLALPTLAMANDVYISQVGDSLDLDIIQDGENNKIGTSTQDVVLGDATTGAGSMTFSIKQQGDSNVIEAQIYGSTYTADWDFIGSNNTVDMLCNSTGLGGCGTVSFDVQVTGDDSTFKFYVGEANDADSATVSFTIDGDKQVTDFDLDGTDANITVVLDSTSSTASSLSTASSSDATLSTDGEGSILDFDVDGDGDIAGHTIDLTATGGANIYTITQSGIYDNNVTASFSGDYQDVNISQSD